MTDKDKITEEVLKGVNGIFISIGAVIIGLLIVLYEFVMGEEL